MTQQTPEANPNRLIGQTVGGKYTVVRMLGEGGMGCVYEAHQKLGDTVRKVAIKTLHQHLSHDPKILQRFEREVGTVAALTHPNTIQVYDFGKTDDGTLYIAMEFVEGKSVAEDLEKNGPMAPERVVKILEQVCGSLEEAHGAGIVHRDLKPDNVVLCEKAGRKDWVEVLDFGIAKRGSEADPNEQKLTQQGMVLGTPPYMSPEQFTGQPIDKRSDIYALGVMAYEMLTGRMPFSGNTAWEWATAHMTAQPVALDLTPQGPHLPPHMKQAIMRALEKNKDARWSNVHEFMDAFAGRTPMPASSGTAAMQQQSPPRQKTEMGGAPVPMDFGTPPPMQGGMPPAQQMGGVPYVAGSPAVAGTPAAGNVVYPAPPPPRDQGGGGGKGLIIGGLFLALLVFGGLGAFAYYRSTTKNTASIPPIPTSTATDPPTATATDTGSAPVPTDTTLPTLSAKTSVPPVGTGGVVVKKDGGTATTSTGTTTTTATTPTQTATQTATQPPPPTGNPNLPQCVVARAFCEKNAPQCEAKKQACLAAGGRM